MKHRLRLDVGKSGVKTRDDWRRHGVTSHNT